MKRRIISLFALSIILIVVLIPKTGQVEGQGLSAPIGTSFTYQGKLMDGGAPATGVYDLTFTLYDSLSGGSQVGSTVIVEDVSVVEGLFTVQLDFGAVFNGTALYLEIGVRPGSGGAFVTLSPRQELTSAPYATHAGQVPWSGITDMPADFADGTDDGETYIAGSGLSLTSGAFGISDSFQLPQSCSNGQITQWNGTGWECATQNAYTAGTGLDLTGGQMSIGGTYQLPQTCSNGQVVQWNGTTWGCTGQNSYTAGTGLSLTGGQMSVASSYQLPQGCGSGQISQWNGSTWVCANDIGASYTAGDGIAITSNVISTNFGGTGSANTVSRSDHTHSNYIASGSAAGGDLTGTYPNPSIAANAVGSSEIADGSVDMADTVNWMGFNIGAANFLGGSGNPDLTIWGTAFTPSANGTCLVILNAYITSGGSATDDPQPTLDLAVDRAGAISTDPYVDTPFSPQDVDTNEDLSASTSYLWSVTSGQLTRFGCNVSDPDGDWDTDELVRCRISYICQ